MDNRKESFGSEGVEVEVEENIEEETPNELGDDEITVLVKKKTSEFKNEIDFIEVLLGSSYEIFRILVKEARLKTKNLVFCSLSLVDFIFEIKKQFSSLESNLEESFNLADLSIDPVLSSQLKKFGSETLKAACFPADKDKIAMKEVKTLIKAAESELNARLKACSKAESKLYDLISEYSEFKTKLTPILSLIVNPETHLVTSVELDITPHLVHFACKKAKITSELQSLFNSTETLVKEFQQFYDSLGREIKNIYSELRQNTAKFRATIPELDFSQFETKHCFIQSIEAESRETVDKELSNIKVKSLKLNIHSRESVAQLNQLTLEKFTQPVELAEFLLSKIRNEEESKLERWRLYLDRFGLTGAKRCMVIFSLQRNLSIFDLSSQKAELVKIIELDNLSLKTVNEGQILIDKVKETDFFASTVNLRGTAPQIQKIEKIVN